MLALHAPGPRAPPDPLLAVGVRLAGEARVRGATAEAETCAGHVALTVGTRGFVAVDDVGIGGRARVGQDRADALARYPPAEPLVRSPLAHAAAGTARAVARPPATDPVHGARPGRLRAAESRESERTQQSQDGSARHPLANGDDEAVEVLSIHKSCPLLVARWSGRCRADRSPILPVMEAHAIRKITQFGRRYHGARL